MAVTLATVLTQTRTYLNDDNAIQFTDPVIIPKVGQAFQELQLELQNIGSPLVRGLSPVLTIAISSTPTSLNLTSSPALPSDFLVPTSVFECTVNTMVGNTPVTEVLYIPLGLAATSTISRWAWQEENLVLAPCTATTYLQVFYKRLLPTPTISTDPIGVLNGEFFLSARAAAMVAASLDGQKDLVDSLNATAAGKLKSLLANNRGSQRPLLKP